MTNAATATGTALGECPNGHRYFSDRPMPTYSGYCDACAVVVPAGTPCAQLVGTDYIWRPVVKWTQVKARKTSRHCTEVCTSAKSSICSCECAGENHGKSLRLAF